MMKTSRFLLKFLLMINAAIVVVHVLVEKENASVIEAVKKERSKHRIVYMPLIDMMPSDPDTIMTALHQAQQITSDRGQDYVVFTADLQLYKVAVNILWAYPEQFDNVVIRLGGMHTQMSFYGSIGSLMAERGTITRNIRSLEGIKGDEETDNSTLYKTVRTFNVTSFNQGENLTFIKSNIGPIYILNVNAGNTTVKANWDIFKIYGVINDTKYPNYDQTLRCCFLFNSNGSQKIIEMKATDKQQFWDPASLRSFHVTCPNPKHGMKKVPDGVAITILGVPCRSGYVTYMTPSYPLRPAGTTLALGTKIAHGNVSAEMIIEWMETYKFLGVDKVVTYYADGLCPLALQVLKYYAKEGILDLRFFEPAGADIYPRIFHPPNPQKWNDNNVAVKDQYERMSGYTYFGIIDHDEFLIPTRNRSLKQMMDDLFKSHNETVAGFEFGEIQYVMSWNLTTLKVKDLYLDRHIRRTQFPLDFLVRKNIYKPSKVDAGFMNTHFISPKDLMERAPADQGYIRHYRGCKSTPLLFCRQLYRQTVDTEMTNWANNIRNKTRQVRKHLYGDENAFITWNTSG